MSSLKDALKKAGFSGTKEQNERKPARGKALTDTIKNQHTRTFCEVCERTLPDVERYIHRNPTTDAQWICVGCVDKMMIEDRFRVTAQSDTSKSKRFRRYYGETIQLDENRKRPEGSSSGRNRNVQGNNNRGRHGQGNDSSRSSGQGRSKNSSRNSGGNRDDNSGNR